MISKIQKSKKQTYFLFSISSPLFCLLTFKLDLFYCAGVWGEHAHTRGS